MRGKDADAARYGNDPGSALSPRCQTEDRGLGHRPRLARTDAVYQTVGTAFDDAWRWVARGQTMALAAHGRLLGNGGRLQDAEHVKHDAHDDDKGQRQTDRTVGKARQSPHRWIVCAPAPKGRCGNVVHFATNRNVTRLDGRPSVALRVVVVALGDHARAATHLVHDTFVVIIVVIDPSLDRIVFARKRHASRGEFVGVGLWCGAKGVCFVKRISAT